MEDRLRVHPLERFAPKEHLFDLGETIAALQQEDYPLLHGHRQITVFKYGPATLLVYDFEAGGELGADAADGVVTIYVMGGALTVRTPEKLYDLGAGMLLVLTPGATYRLVAHQPSQVLFTVYMEPASLEEEQDASSESGVPEGRQ